MKICVVSNLYESHERGGAERVAKIMVEGFINAGHDVVVITTRPEVGLAVEQKEKVKIYRFRPLNLFYYLDLVKHGAMARIVWHFLDVFNWSSALRVRNILQKEMPDLVVTHNLKGVGYCLPLVIRGLKIKHIHVLHDVQLAVPSGLIIKGKEDDFLVGGFAARMYARACRALFRSPDVVVSPSLWLMKFYEDRGFFAASTRKIIPNPLPTVESLPPVKSQKQNCYLFVGQMEKHKGIEWLIDFWRTNKMTGELLVVGDGSFWPVNVPLNVKLLGKQGGDKLNTFFAQSDFLIVPSLCYENSPTVIPLAYANATPVIVAKIGGAGELVEQNKTGFLFEAGDVESLRGALEKAGALTAEVYQKMSENCLAQAQKFSVREYVDKLILP
ncbi:hypothetical protein A2482_00635 [Candidatus Falkowbacteria bacterium RIFOXYC2_FULL_48_21]|uniref:Glycosyltransferase subfamily 4-like N-terminal domain-containing protein n=1 Tax=Candidatus Falkowbacteria bacterium RIFOXYC2_FULL_48_21 TaxID=1798005 RepID=A0A1F5T5N6_9BACT|nr:MAG: hypothetical protein A2482_00635 [Candidatus Falkowbacteria bacterium RIFOXYC2_FULL_48_21]